MKNAVTKDPTPIVPILLVLAAVLYVEARDWLQNGPGNADSDAGTLCDVAPIIVAAVGLALGCLWGWTMRGRAGAMRGGTGFESDRDGTEERERSSGSYREGAEMLGGETQTVRLGGVYALERLARERVEDEHIRIMNLLCAFARHPPDDEVSRESSEDDETVAIPRRRRDVEQAVQAIGRRSEAQVEFEGREQWRADLTTVNLSGADLLCANLANACLWRANLAGADLMIVDLQGADLQGADLQGANLAGANLNLANLPDANLAGANLTGGDLTDAILQEADLSGAILSNANLTGAKGLTQERLDRAVIRDGETPPDLSNAICVVSGEPLIWRGGKLPPGS